MTITINEFVSREVVYCVSSLVSTLISASAETGAVGDIGQEELFDLCQRDDWKTPARENGWEVNEEGQMFKQIEDDDDMTDPNLYADSWQDACEQDDLEPYRDEAYEHWIVTDWLAARLEEKGEIVARDIAGLTIWGRCTTGQAISMDYVIGQIYNEMIA